MNPKKSKLLFSVTAQDCEWSYARGSGNGGQARNKSNNAVHCSHRPSGAHGYSEASRSQADNKKDAFEKMYNSEQFQRWLKLESMKRSGELTEIERAVEQELKKTKTEIKIDGQWRQVQPNQLVDNPEDFDITKLEKTNEPVL
jgi:protein subunit release factor B